MDEATSRVARLFDALSGDYDRSGVDFFEPIAAGLVHRAAPAAGQRWLDVGCGPGAVLLPVAEAVAPHGGAVGVDISSAMVDRARAAAAESGLSNVDVHVGDALAPPVDGPFDGVTSSLVLFFLTDPQAALESWSRLMRPGGRLVVSTFGDWDPALEHVEEVLEPWVPESMKDPRTVDDDSPFTSDAGMERLVASAGYADVRTEGIELPVRFEDADSWFAFSWSTGQRGMWLSVPEGERPAVRAEAARRFAQHADADGSATFRVGIRYTLGTAPH